MTSIQNGQVHRKRKHESEAEIELVNHMNLIQYQPFSRTQLTVSNLCSFMPFTQINSFWFTQIVKDKCFYKLRIVVLERNNEFLSSLPLSSPHSRDYPALFFPNTLLFVLFPKRNRI